MLADLETKAPEKGDVQVYERWKVQLEGVRSKLRQQSMNAVARARLAAMTTTRAVFSYDDLASLAPYDLVVFGTSPKMMEVKLTIEQLPIPPPQCWCAAKVARAKR